MTRRNHVPRLAVRALASVSRPTAWRPLMYGLVAVAIAPCSALASEAATFTCYALFSGDWSWPAYIRLTQYVDLTIAIGPGALILGAWAGWFLDRRRLPLGRRVALGAALGLFVGPVTLWAISFGFWGAVATLAPIKPPRWIGGNIAWLPIVVISTIPHTALAGALIAFLCRPVRTG